MEENKPVKPVVKKSAKEATAEATATAALKAALEANSESKNREAEKLYAIEKKNNMLKMCKESPTVTRTVSKLYAPIIGKVYTFLYNGVPVTVWCDGKPHEYPEFIAKRIDEKLNKISESNTYKEVIDERTNQDDLL
jgi:hypothetical protein